VRQNFTQYLVKTLQYPASLIAFEKEIRVGELKKRFDILVYNTDHKPWMMIECKASHVELDTGVLEQVLRYHSSVPVEYIVITNGHYHYGWQRKGQELLIIDKLPLWLKG
jgi:hypothetical protein